MRHFSRFLTTFGSARAAFGVDGRQKWGISPVFCLLSGPCGPILESAVDKNEAFSLVFVYFRDRAMKHGYGQNAAFGDLPVSVAFSPGFSSHNLKKMFAARSTAFFTEMTSPILNCGCPKLPPYSLIVIK